MNVGRQSFRLLVTERGIVRPARITPIKSQISGNQGKLIWVIDEGMQINKGLLVARFDTKPLMDILQKAEQQLADAEAQLEVSLKSLELLKEAGKSKKEASQRKLELAGIKANDLKNGSGPLKRQQLEQVVKKAVRTYAVKTKELEDIKPLQEKGHVTMREYERAENERITAQEALVLARAELTNFDKYEWPRILREAEVITDAAEIDLARVQRTAELEQQQQLSKVEKYRRDLAIKKKELKKAKKEVAACDVYSPADGILLYSLLPRQNKKRKIQLGDSIWNGQTFLEVPDTSDLVVEINIREIDVAKLTPGMPAEIILDAYPEQIFSGTLLTIDSLAQKDAENSSIRRFFAKIRILETTQAVHVGMSASVKIIYKELQDILAIPAGAVTYQNGRTVVKKLTPAGGVITEVKLGDSGIKWVQLLAGLSEGDRIITNAF
jgi:HlyD family secretion protein